MRYLSFLILIFCKLNAIPISTSISIPINSSKDYEILDQFFRLGIGEEEYFYVLEGNKPISIRNFSSLDALVVTKDWQHTERELNYTLLMREAIPLWNTLCSSQKKFVLKTTPFNSKSSPELGGWEVLFINVPKLQEVIEENLSLFRYLLSPTLQPQQLANRIAYSNEKLSDILLHNCVLIGIVLGFDTYNSLVGGRKENICASSLSRDMAPFAPKNRALSSQFGYEMYYLERAGGDESPEFKNDFSPLNSSRGFVTIEEELSAIEAIGDSFPPSLMMEKPAFIFAAYKGGPSNHPLFERLKQSQKQAQRLLKSSTFLEEILTKIGGKKPLISCEKPAFSLLELSFFRNHLSLQTWKYILENALQRFEDQEQQQAFIEGLFDSSSPSVPSSIGVSKATLAGLKKALHYLSITQSYFDALSKDSHLRVLVPNQLYYQTIVKSQGKELKNIDRIRLSYLISDLEHHILFANHDTWLNLSQTISGFAHGLQGMHVGEKREIFIHPALAYGILTTLPPGMGLIVNVELLDVDEETSTPLPALEAVDLNWIKNPKLFLSLEESIQRLPRFIGSFYGHILEEIEGPNKENILRTFYPNH